MLMRRKERRLSLVIESARILSGAKCVGSPLLNRVGVKVFRSVVARGLYRLRSQQHPFAAELTKDGMILIEDFLPADELARAREEADRLVADGPPAKVDVHGPAYVQRYLLEGLDDQVFPWLSRWRVDDRPLEIAGAAERRLLRRGDGVSVLQRVLFRESDDSDRESELHVDTFFSTHKLWLYLDDVGEQDGPLVYVPGSHKMSWRRLRHDYAESCSANVGSRRINEEEVEERRLKRRVITCRANTLIVVDTCGYHCRSAGEVGRSRRALHMSFRFNPFVPLIVRPSEGFTRRHPGISRALTLAMKGQ